MTIKLNGSTAGSVALDAPASTTGNADISFKLPVADGTASQSIITDASGNLSFATPKLPHGFVFMDSQYFDSSTTLLGFNSSTTNDKSFGVTIDRTNKRFTPTVSGTYLVHGMLDFYHGGSGAYTPILYLYRNGSSYTYARNIVNYNGGHYDSLNVQAMMSFNGSSDYVDMRANHNGGGNATMNTHSSLSIFRVGA